VLQFFSWPDRREPIGTVYRRVLERIEIMDRSGYEAVWLAEHHIQSFSVCLSIRMMATLVAARTRRIHIGTACRWRRSITPCASPRRSRCSTSSPAGA